jgi:CBS domain-containing protein
MTEPRVDPTEYHDEYSETLGTEFRKLEDALLSDTVGLLASSEPIQLRESASVAEALQRMTEQGRGAVVVIDDEGRLAGIFTDQEVIPRVLGPARDVQRTRLSEVMIRDPEVVRPDDRICYAVNRMTSMGCRTIPLVDEDRRPVGVLTVDDVAKWLGAIFPEAILNLRPGDRLKRPAQRDGG